MKLFAKAGSIKEEEMEEKKHHPECPDQSKVISERIRTDPNNVQKIEICLSCGSQRILIWWYKPHQPSTCLTKTKERWEKDHRQSVWRNNGREGHAPDCSQKDLDRPLQVVQSVAVAWSTKTTLQCRGCKGVFIEWD